MDKISFDLNALELNGLCTDELSALDAGAYIGFPKGITDTATKPAPGYTEATIIWSQIP